MNRQQRRTLARSKDPQAQEAAVQEKALMEWARMGHILHLQAQVETLTKYLMGKFPNDWVERSEGGVIRPKGYQEPGESGPPGGS